MTLRSIGVLCVSVSKAAAANPTVDVAGLGKIVGTLSAFDAGIALFRGIPFAEPPLGDRRFQPPIAHGPWAAPLQATDWGAKCVQAPGNFSHISKMSEDCLFLNVAAPLSAVKTRGNRSSSSKLPVMVWIHGGGYTMGSSDYDLDVLVAGSKGAVLCVSINYRLNLFGFIGSESLSAAAADGSSGNYGIADQRLALAWVQAHIADFGGDPSAVTLFGESAGGNSIMSHLAAKPSYALYANAVIESGTYTGGAFPMSFAQAAFDKVLGATGCADVACLVGLDAASLFAAGAGSSPGWGPVVDGIALTATPVELIASGKYNALAPVLIGSNRDEMAFTAIDGLPSDLNETGFEAVLRGGQFSSEEIEKAKAIYANSSSGYVYPSRRGIFSEWWWAAMRVKTDLVPGIGACGVRWLARMLLNGGSPAVYTYLFAHPTQTDPYDGRVPGLGPGSVLVPHASEIGYVFDLEHRLTPGAEADLAALVSRFWTNFARSADPNRGAPTPVAWPKYTADADQLLRFAVGEDMVGEDGSRGGSEDGSREGGAVEAQVEAHSSDGGGVAVQSGLRQQACDFMEGRLRAGRSSAPWLWSSTGAL